MFTSPLKLQGNVAITLVILAALFGADLMAAWLLPQYLFSPPLKYAAGLFAIIFVFSFATSNAFLWWFCALATLLGIAQFGHLAFFGNLIFPHEYLLVVTEFNEVADTLKGIWSLLLAPVALGLTSFLLMALGLWRWGSKRQRSRWANGAIVVILLLAPLRGALTKRDAFGRNPSAIDSTLFNSYATLTFFVAQMLPQKLLGQDFVGTPTPPPLLLRPAPSLQVILLLGESLPPHRMSLFGYPRRDTTPFLAGLQAQGRLIARHSLACGVSTDVAVPLLFNQICSSQGMPQIISMNSCLFKMAKENGFATHFYSAQSGDFLKGIYHYLCPKYLDHFLDGTQLSDQPEFTKGGEDMRMVALLEQVDWSKSNFIVFQQRASHSPYHLNYPATVEPFSPVGGSETRDEFLSRTYDSSVRYSDGFYEALVGALQSRLQGPAHVFLTSDHGESTGQGGRWGHLQLRKEQFEVPFAYLHLGQGAGLTELLQGEDRIFTHRELGHLIGYLLGYGESPLLPQREMQVVGTDIDGWAGTAQVAIQGKKAKILRRHFP